MATIYVAGITTWAGELAIDNGSMLWFWALFALVLAFYGMLLRENRFSGRTWWLSLAIGIALPVAACFQCDRYAFVLCICTLSGFLCVTLSGRLRLV